MNSENNLQLQTDAFVELVKIAIGTSKGDFDFTALNDADWLAVMEESAAHAVTLMNFNATKDFNYLIPKAIYDRWFKASIKVMSRNTVFANAQAELDRLMTENGINYVILKGVASGYYYPDYAMRTSGDIDLLTDIADFPRVKEVLINAGYEMSLEDHDLHTVFAKGDVELELHKKPAGMPEGIQGEMASEFLRDMAVNYVRVTNPAYSRPTDQNHALVILFHTIYHMFAGGMGIRHLCDWACFVNKTHTEAFWQAELLPLFEKMGLLRFVMTLTQSCIDYLNIDVPVWFIKAKKELSDEIFEKVLACGNFGRKQGKYLSDRYSSGNGVRYTFAQKLKNMFVSLCKTNSLMYPILKKVPILHPFIFVWRIIKYIVLSLLGKKTSLNERMKYADERAAVFDKFEIYR
ncbi:MAG: nucleotidyltransferase family protein [Clostridia bacterium]|nr:nucleotidyltransferase family protein [Clostridia bacterium]